MAGSQSHKTIEIKSSVHPYTAFFSENINEELENTTQPGDILIVDTFILQTYKELFQNIENEIQQLKNRVIVLESNDQFHSVCE